MRRGLRASKKSQASCNSLKALLLIPCKTIALLKLTIFSARCSVWQAAPVTWLYKTEARRLIAARQTCFRALLCDLLQTKNFKFLKLSLQADASVCATPVRGPHDKPKPLSEERLAVRAKHQLRRLFKSSIQRTIAHDHPQDVLTDPCAG